MPIEVTKGIDDVHTDGEQSASLEQQGNDRPQGDNDYDVEEVEQVYRKLDLRIIPGMTGSLQRIFALKLTIHSFLDPVFSLLCHSFQHWYCSDHEQGATS